MASPSRLKTNPQSFLPTLTPGFWLFSLSWLLSSNLDLFPFHWPLWKRKGPTYPSPSAVLCRISETRSFIKSGNGCLTVLGVRKCREMVLVPEGGFHTASSCVERWMCKMGQKKMELTIAANALLQKCNTVFMKAEFSWPSHLSKVLSFNAYALGIKAPTHGPWAHIQTIVLSLQKMPPAICNLQYVQSRYLTHQKQPKNISLSLFCSCYDPDIYLSHHVPTKGVSLED